MGNTEIKELLTDLHRNNFEFFDVYPDDFFYRFMPPAFRKNSIITYDNCWGGSTASVGGVPVGIFIEEMRNHIKNKKCIEIATGVNVTTILYLMKYEAAEIHTTSKTPAYNVNLALGLMAMAYVYALDYEKEKEPKRNVPDVLWDNTIKERLQEGLKKIPIKTQLIWLKYLVESTKRSLLDDPKDPTPDTVVRTYGELSNFLEALNVHLLETKVEDVVEYPNQISGGDKFEFAMAINPLTWTRNDELIYNLTQKSDHFLLKDSKMKKVMQYIEGRSPNISYTNICKNTKLFSTV